MKFKPLLAAAVSAGTLFCHAGLPDIAIPRTGASDISAIPENSMARIAVSRRPEATPICRNVPSFLLLTTMTLFLSVHYVKTERRRKAEYSLMMMRFRS